MSDSGSAETSLRRSAVHYGLLGDTPPGPEWLARARSYLADARAAQLEAHQSGAPGDVTTSLRSLSIDLLLSALHARVGGEATGLAVLALGGYGRAELCPHSDIDLLLVVPEVSAERARAAAEALLYPLWDLGLKVGHSVRTVAEVADAARSDLHFRVALLERRLVAGPAAALSGIDGLLAAEHAREGWLPLAHQIAEAQRRRRAKAGGSAYLQEPDLKNGVGALRDVHAALWLVRLARGVAGPGALGASGLLPHEDAARFVDARATLLRLRCALHFQSTRPTEVLSLEQQDAVSAALGIEGDVAARIGALMRGYFDAADHVRRCVELIEGVVLGEPEPEGEGEGLREDGFLIRRNGVARAEHQLVFDEDPLRLVRLFRLCQRHGARPDRATSLLVRARQGLLEPALATSPAVAALMREMLAETGRVFPALDALREHGLLYRILPEFAPLHCLVQFEFYHRWTADVHTLRCLRELDAVFASTAPAEQAHREVLSGTARPALLYAILLLHDIAKAEGIEGHAERGAAEADPILTRLGFPPEERRIAALVILHHLRMGLYWQRHDIDDPANIARFAEMLGESEVLRHLCVHTCCDARATSPDLWTEGKDRQHMLLYRRTLQQLTLGAAAPDDSQRRAAVGTEVRRQLAGSVPEDELDAHLRLMPASYFLHAEPTEIAGHVVAVHRLIAAVLADQPEAALRPQVSWLSEDGIQLVQVVTWDRAGLFGRMAGAFAVAGINILSCRAFSRADQVVVDLFRVALPEDADAARVRFAAALQTTLVEGEDLRAMVDAEDKRWSRLQPRRRPSLADQPVVRVYDAPELERSVVEIQAPDRLGLLFRLGTAIRDAGYAITFANVATERGYALDTFYLVPEPSVRSRPEPLPQLEAALAEVLAAKPAFP